MIYFFFCLLYTACIFLRYADFILVLLIRRTKQKDNCPRSCSEHTVSLRTTVSKFIAAMGCLAMLSQIACLTYSCSAVCPLLSLLTPAIFPSPLKCKRTKSCFSLCASPRFVPFRAEHHQALSCTVMRAASCACANCSGVSVKPPRAFPLQEKLKRLVCFYLSPLPCFLDWSHSTVVYFVPPLSLVCN